MIGTDVVVVGGGIAGTSIAWELARRGTAVTLFEQANLGAGASGRNTGTLLHQTEPAVAEMLRASQASYRELEGGEVDFAWTPRDEVLIARDGEQLRTIAAKGEQFAAQGVAVEALDGDALRAAFPAFGPDVLGGRVLGGASTVHAETTTRAFAEAARHAGAEITGIRVAQIRTTGGRVAGVLTDAGRVPTDAVVLATGPWLTELLPATPVRAGRGWLMRTQRLAVAVPWIVEEVSWPDQHVLGAAARPVPLSDLAAGRVDEPIGDCFFMCPLPGGDALIGATLATSLRDAIEGIGAPQRIATRALELAPGLGGTAAITRAWSGLRPMTPDGLPLVGPAGPDGLYIHGGHASLGMQAAPATAGWLARHMHGEHVPDTFAELQPDRFERTPA